MNYNEIFASCIMSELRNEADLSKSCEYCKELADFSEAIKGKGLSSKEYALAINLFSFVYRENIMLNLLVILEKVLLNMLLIIFK